MKRRKKIRLKDLKGFAITVGVLLVAFYLFDSVLMPRYVQQQRTTKVPNVVGQNLEEAIQVLAKAGLTGKKADTRTDRQYPEGTVVVQTPAADTEVKFGRGIYLTVSGGEPMVTVPGLRGRSLRDATFALERYGLVLGATRYEVSEEYPQGTVIDQETPEGTVVPSGKIINVVVSQGKSADQVPVPDVLKKSFTDAERILIQAGLKIGNILFQVNTELLPNTVIDQFPKPGELVPGGQAIDLVIAQKGERQNEF